MKIRTGFVSNSSSSSFCMVGVEIDPGEAEDLALLDAIGYQGIEGNEVLPPGYGRETCDYDLVVVGTDTAERVGLDAEAHLAADGRVSELAARLTETFKALKYRPKSKPTFMFGEAGNG